MVCPKSKCTDFLFKCLLDSPEITSYLLQSMILGKLHSGSTFFPLIIAVLEVIFRKCLAHRLQFLYVFNRPEIMTLQFRFQLREEAEIARSLIWALGRLWKYGNVFLRQKILELKAQCELARYRVAAPNRLQCPFGLAGPVFEVVPRHLCRRRD